MAKRKSIGLRAHKALDGSMTFTATVRVAGFKSHSETFPTRDAASAWFVSKQAELRKLRREQGAAVRPDLPGLTVAGVIASYLDDREVKKLRTYDDVHRLLCEWSQDDAGAVRVLDVSPLTWREARERLGRGRGPGTTNRYLSAMRGAWNWARAAALIPVDRIWPPKLMLREPSGRQRYLTDAELARLLEAAQAHSAIMHAAVVASVATGLRLGELLRLDWPDVNLTRQVLEVRVTKTDRPRTVHLPAPACDALKALQGEKVRRIAGPVFTMPDGTRLRKTTLNARWRNVRTAAGLTDFRWHDLRHSAASFLAQAGANLFEIGSVLGHRSPSVTQRYSHLVQGAPLAAHAKLEEKLRRGKQPT
jgi:integrase